jgi:hypothetical protein
MRTSGELKETGLPRSCFHSFIGDLVHECAGNLSTILGIAEPISVRLLCSLRNEVHQRSMSKRSAVFDGNEISRPAELNVSQLQWLD